MKAFFAFAGAIGLAFGVALYYRNEPALNGLFVSIALMLLLLAILALSLRDSK